MRIVAMLPARLGSKRVKHKNLRLLGNKPLVAHVADACKKAGIFDEIFINSESDIFKPLCDELGIAFYQRDEKYATDVATNDQFILDFVTNVDCDLVVQVNPTCPFVSSYEIKEFVKKMIDENYDTMLSYKQEYVEGLFKKQPINFDPMKQMPRSQDLEPIYLHCSTILAWKKTAIISNMKKHGCTTYGADGKVGVFVFRGFSTVDIDNEEDFVFAEIVWEFINSTRVPKTKYFKPSKKNIKD